MPSSPPSSPPCAVCRLEWTPSRWLVAALLALSVLAAVAVNASAVPAPWRMPLAGLAALHGLLLARRARDALPCRFAWPGRGAPATLSRGGRTFALHAVTLERRGPLVWVHGRDDAGTTHRLFWWPDTLSRADLRRLVLAAGQPCDKPLPSMAA